MFDLTTTWYLLFCLGIGAAALAVWLLLTRTRLLGAATLAGAATLLAVSVYWWQEGSGLTVHAGDLAAANAKITQQARTINNLEAKLVRRETNSSGSVLQHQNELTALRRKLVESDKQLSVVQERVTHLNARADEVTNRLAQTESDLDRAKRDLASEKSAHSQLIRESAHRLDLVLERARSARQHIGYPLSAQDMPTGQTLHANERRFELIEQELARLDTAERIETAALPDRSASDQLDDLRDRLAYGISTDDYDVEVYPDREMIGGRRGRYYVVDLKDAEAGVKFGFNAGRYTLDTSDKNFRKALSAFMRDVVNKIDGNADYRLMVRGSADSAAYRGQQKAAYNYRQISYLPKLASGRYVDASETRRVDTRITNSDLPFLRARYLKDLVADVYPTTTPTILEGDVTSKVDRNDRNAELLLFVDWD